MAKPSRLDAALSVQQPAPSALRRILTGVQEHEQQARNRWSVQPAVAASNPMAGLSAPSEAVSAYGSVRDRARAYERLHTVQGSPAISRATTAIPNRRPSLMVVRGKHLQQDAGVNLETQDKENARPSYAPPDTYTKLDECSQPSLPFLAVLSARVQHTPPLSSTRPTSQPPPEQSEKRQPTIHAGAFLPKSRSGAGDTVVGTSPPVLNTAAEKPASAAPFAGLVHKKLAAGSTQQDYDPLTHGHSTPILTASCISARSSLDHRHLTNINSQTAYSKGASNAGIDVELIQIKTENKIESQNSVARHSPLAPDQSNSILPPLASHASHDPAKPFSRSALANCSVFRTQRRIKPPATDAACENVLEFPNRLDSASTVVSNSIIPPKRQRAATLGPSNSAMSVESHFEAMINALGLPPTVRRKMLALDLTVKTGMLRSSATSLSAASMSRAVTAPMLERTTQETPTAADAVHGLSIPRYGEEKLRKKRPLMVRKVKSFVSQSINSPAADIRDGHFPDGFQLVHSPTEASSTAVELQSPESQNYTDKATSQSAATQANILKHTTVQSLHPQLHLKKLRVLLRNERLSWVAEWARFGGYDALLERLHDVLALEWREEQHDDQVLHELLRCCRALLMTEVGRLLLATYCPLPFRPLVELLYSDKKPGDLSTRHLIIELLTGLFQVVGAGAPACQKEDWGQDWRPLTRLGHPYAQPQSKSFTTSSLSPQLPMLATSDSYLRPAKGSNASSSWESAGFPADFTFSSNSTRSAAISPETSCAQLVDSLMRGPPNEKEEAKVDFIKRSHRPRPYKLWMDEIAGVISDYFWIFCHSNNTFWRLQNLDEEQVELPKVPGGMTGGVEYEAMEYCTAHLRLLNRMVHSSGTKERASAILEAMDESGLERIILTLRKCSTTYYPHVHLEVARYIDLCLSSGYPLSSAIRKHLEAVRSLSNNTLVETQERPSNRPGHRRTRTEGADARSCMQ